MWLVKVTNGKTWITHFSKTLNIVIVVFKILFIELYYLFCWKKKTIVASKFVNESKDDHSSSY
jgi:hypothetical protein